MSKNQSENTQKSGIGIYTSIGKRVSKVLLVTFCLGLGLCVLDNNYLKKECAGSKQSTVLSCFSSPIVGNLGISLITSVITYNIGS